jgi:hypothetical protein
LSVHLIGGVKSTRHHEMMINSLKSGVNVLADQLFSFVSEFIDFVLINQSKSLFKAQKNMRG